MDLRFFIRLTIPPFFTVVLTHLPLTDHPLDVMRQRAFHGRWGSLSAYHRQEAEKTSPVASLLSLPQRAYALAKPECRPGECIGVLAVGVGGLAVFLPFLILMAESAQLMWQGENILHAFFTDFPFFLYILKTQRGLPPVKFR